MSEIEKQQRAAYQKRRKVLIVLQTVFAVLLTVALLLTGFLHFKVNKASFVPYTEEGGVIYKAYLSDNQFYSEEYLNGSHAYVASLIEKMTADFSYNLEMGADNVAYQYSYKIDAQLEIKDKESQMAIYNPVFQLKPLQSAEVEDNILSITDSVELDYNKYNKLAKDFIASYNLDDTQSLLIVRMYVNVLGQSESFAENNEGSYTIELFVPLNKDTVTPYVVTPVKEEEQKVLAVENSKKDLFKKPLIALAVIDFLAITLLLIYTFATRDKHLDYAIKVKRILSSYKSYIQRVNNPIKFSEYQVLMVDTFTEMLEIRDTLQMPVIMYENDDKTCCHFFITTNTNILYLYEISVKDDFDRFSIAKASIEKPRKTITFSSLDD